MRPQLRGIWLGIIDTSKSSFHAASESHANLAPSDPFAHAEVRGGRTSGFLPNPFASFVPSKTQPRAEALRQRTSVGPHETRVPTVDVDAKADGAARIDVLAWLARATLDVIGAAGTFVCLTCRVLFILC